MRAQLIFELYLFSTCVFPHCVHMYTALCMYICYSGMPAYSAQCNICDNDQLADLHISPKITTTCDCLCVWSAVLSSWLTMLCSCLRSHSRTVLSHEAVTTLPLKAHVPTYIQIPNVWTTAATSYLSSS